MTRSTAHQGAVSITDKRGQRVVLASTAPSAYTVRIRYLMSLWKRLEQEEPAGPHEHYYSAIYDGSKIAVCACGSVRAEREAQDA